MNGLKVFEFNSDQLRTVEVNGTPWFVATDVCKVLDIKNVTQAVARLNENQRSMLNIGRQGNANCVNEYGLYKLIFKSRKKEAEQFQDWITDEVIPSIRETGTYSLEQTQPKTSAEMFMMTAEQMLNQERRMDRLEKQQENITEIVGLNTIDWRKKISSILGKIAENRGGDMNHQQVRKESYEILARRAGCNLEIRLTNKRKKMALEGVTKSKILKVNKLDVIADDKRLTEIYLAVVKDIAIRNQVDASDLPQQLENVQ